MEPVKATEKIYIKDIEITQEDKIGLMKTWEGHNIINGNLDSIVNDFNFANQNMFYEVSEVNNNVVEGIKNEKMRFLNAHICGVICTMAPDSYFNKNYITLSGETEEETETKEKSNDFARLL